MARDRTQTGMDPIVIFSQVTTGTGAWYTLPGVYKNFTFQANNTSASTKWTTAIQGRCSTRSTGTATLCALDKAGEGVTPTNSTVSVGVTQLRVVCSSKASTSDTLTIVAVAV